MVMSEFMSDLTADLNDCVFMDVRGGGAGRRYYKGGRAGGQGFFAEIFEEG